MKIRLSSELFPLYGIFGLMVFWDVIQLFLPYLQYILLIFLLWYSKKKESLYINKYFLFVMFVIFLHGICCVFFLEHKLGLLLTQLGAITLCFIAYSNIIKKYTIHQIFEVYWVSALFMCIFGVVSQILKINIFRDPNIRMNSLSSEPASLCYFLSPIVFTIVFWYIIPGTRDDDVKFYSNKFGILILLLAYLWSFSSVGYFGLLVLILIALCKRGGSLKQIITFALCVISFIGIYFAVPDIQKRVDDTIWALAIEEDDDAISMNLSTYTLYNNAHVTYEIVKNTNGLGIGLGAYQLWFDKYTLLVSDRANRDYYYMNNQDANSGFLRISSELGIFGIVLFMLWIFYFNVKTLNKYSAYSCALFVWFLMFLLRHGNYLNGGIVIFLCLYTKIYYESMKLKRDFSVPLKKHNKTVSLNNDEGMNKV